MNVSLTIEPASLAELAELRELYLDGLLGAQEAFLEAAIADGYGLKLMVHEQLAGYALVSVGTLLEFFVRDAFLPRSHLIFRKLVHEAKIERALVKSFDHLALACALDIQVEVKVLGILVRDLVKRALPQLPGVHYTQRSAQPQDLPHLLAVQGSPFDNLARLAAAIAAGRVRVFEQGDRLVAFGVLKPVIAGRAQVDVGLVVDNPFRRRGYAAYVLRDLVEFCEERGLEPISGCAADNQASINLGLRVGFVSRYRLLELRFVPRPAAPAS
jgi:GNAT superfamily N-acetyltransferase